MTQFSLVTTNNELGGLRSIERIEDEFLMVVAAKLFPGVPLNKIYLLNADKKDIDSLMTDAQRAVIDNKSFQETELYKTINELVQNVDDLVFWYGSDYDDLEYVYDAQSLLDKLEEAVNEPFCEAYLHYKKAN